MTGIVVGGEKELAELAPRVAELAAEGIASETIRSYRGTVATWERWAGAHGIAPFPVQSKHLAAWIAERAETHRPATLARELAALATWHSSQGLAAPGADPIVRAVMRGIRRHYGTAQVRKAALRLAHLVELYQEEPRTLRGLRDRAVVLLGWAGAFRRSELAGLELRDVSNVAEGITVNLRRSKTDVDGAGQLVGIPRASRRQLCPVGALGAWIVGAGILEGPLFRELASQDNLRGRMSDRCVCRIVKAAAIRLGLDPRPFGGHSLRRGFAAEAARLGIPDRDIARQTRHKSAASLHVYTSEAGIFIDNVAARLL